MNLEEYVYFWVILTTIGILVMGTLDGRCGAYLGGLVGGGLALIFYLLFFDGEIVGC